MRYLSPEMLLITDTVLQEDVRHRLRLSHPASQVEVRRQRPDHLQATDPAVAPIVNPGARRRRCSVADQPRQVLGVQQGKGTSRQPPVSARTVACHFNDISAIMFTTTVKMRVMP